MNILESIRQKIISEFSPKYLEIIDNSASHAGHAGVRDSQSQITHLKIVISKNDVAGKTIVEKHRNLNSLLSDHFKIIHSIEISLVS